jgi:hypothetical protein
MINFNKRNGMVLNRQTSKQNTWSQYFVGKDAWDKIVIPFQQSSYVHTFFHYDDGYGDI